MATLDAMQTPPAASLAAILSSPVTHIQCALFSPGAISNSSCSPGLGENDESSTSDKENSPSYAFCKSSRSNSASPAMKTTLSFSPIKQQLSFTPQRVRAPPRAWERRPATPYILRNEGQKIWKRVPLQEIGVEINQRISRKEKDEKENYLRVVKRLRLDTNEIVSIPGDSNQQIAAVGTLWEEQNIEKDGSPKKKKCAEFRTQDYLPGESVKDEHGTLDTESTIDLTHEQKVENPAQGLMEDSKLLNSEHRTDHNNDSSIETKAQHSLGRKIEQGDRAGEDFVPIVANGHTKGVDEIPCLTLEKNEDCTDKPEPSSSAFAVTDHDRCLHHAPSDVRTEDVAITGDEEASQSNEIMTSYTLASQEENEEPHKFDQPNGRAPSVSVSPDPDLNRSATQSDNEETAFLRDFLERTQASKAARTIFGSQRSSRRLSPIKESESCLETNATETTETVDDVEDDDLSPPLESINLQPPLESVDPLQSALTNDIKPSSPTRRSTRTTTRVAYSRIPRSVTLNHPVIGFAMPSRTYSTTPCVNPILLKRATGNEFVFNAKSQQTLAVMTQSNTKKNRGEAVHVTQRLAQLKKELEVRQQEGSEEAQAEQVKFETDAITDEVPKDSSKKRKRGKKDDANALKAKRRIRWPSDEQLAVYKEPTPSAHDSETESGSDEIKLIPLSIPGPVQSDEASNRPISTPKDRTASKSETKAKLETSVDDSAKSKVRRIRKIKLDSVNGTPAPKTRSRSITIEAEPAQEGRKLDGGRRLRGRN